MQLEQIYVSAVAFSAVFIMLTILAGLMGLLTRIFPGVETPKKAPRTKAGGLDPKLIAVMTAAVSTAVPGGRVTEIKEVQ